MTDDMTSPVISPTDVEEQEVSVTVEETVSASADVDPEVAESNAVADALNSLQTLIERNANELDRLQTEMKQMRESLKNIFENDAILAEAEDVAKQASQQLKERKQQVDNNPEVRQLKLKMSDLKEEMKEIEETLNNHLINLFQMTGSSSFDTSDGDQREFVLRAKVKPKSSK